MYEYFDDKVFLKRAQNFCSSLIARVEELLREKDINSQMFLVGSGGRNMITRNGSGPIDFDYNLNIISCPNWENTKDIKDKVMVAFNNALAEKGLKSCSDSTASLTTKPIYYEDVPEVEFSIDLAIVTLDDKGLWNRLIHNKDRYGNTRNDRWIWNIAPNSQKIKEKADLIKSKNLWPLVRDVYLEKKNFYLARRDNSHTSFIIYIESVNEIYTKIRK